MKKGYFLVLIVVITRFGGTNIVFKSLITGLFQLHEVICGRRKQLTSFPMSVYSFCRLKRIVFPPLLL